MEIAAHDLKLALERWCAAMKQAAPELNELDARIGDGDLGATLEKCAIHVGQALPAADDSLAGIFKACAAACAKASGSSFGTLLAVGCMSAARTTAGLACLDRAALVALLEQALAQLSARGGAALGDKTMLDSLDAVKRAIAEAPEGASLAGAVTAAAGQALDEFRARPNLIGRARMFAERTIGMDDPGMVAILRMAQAIGEA
jgi:dihydroxyacetone kinase-like protein